MTLWMMSKNYRISVSFYFKVYQSNWSYIMNKIKEIKMNGVNNTPKTPKKHSSYDYSRRV